MIQKDGFYCRTNPFDGRYYRYGDILDCCLVESQRGTRRQRNALRLLHEIHRPRKPDTPGSSMTNRSTKREIERAGRQDREGKRR